MDASALKETGGIKQTQFNRFAATGTVRPQGSGHAHQSAPRRGKTSRERTAAGAGGDCPERAPTFACENHALMCSPCAHRDKERDPPSDLHQRLSVARAIGPEPRQSVRNLESHPLDPAAALGDHRLLHLAFHPPGGI